MAREPVPAAARHAHPEFVNFVNDSVHKFTDAASGVDATGPAEDVPTGFSSPKKAVIALRKRKPRSTLRTVARSLGVSRAAAWKHLARLEGAGLVERECRAGRPGRPAAMFRLSAPSQRLFPGAYTQLTLGALAFLERRLGRAAVVGRLEERAAGLAERHRPRLAGRDLEGRVCELARIRDEEG